MDLQSFKYSIADVKDLIGRWTDIIKGEQQPEESECQKLYGDTEEIVSYLGRLVKEDTNASTVSNLCNIIIEELGQIFHPELDKSKQLIEKNILRFQGSYLPIRHLIETISKINKPETIHNFELLLNKISGNLPIFPFHEDLEKLTLLHVESRDLLKWSKTPHKFQKFGKDILIDRINKMENLREIGFKSVEEIIDFFGEDCANIFTLNLKGCPKVKNKHIQKISEHFLNLKHLLLERADINSDAGPYFAKTLTQVDLSGCIYIRDINFLQNCPNLTHVNLSGIVQLKDISFLRNCPHLIQIDLSDCRFLRDFSFLKDRLTLTHVNLYGCSIENVTFLKGCSNLTQIHLGGGGTKINNFSFLKDYPNLTHFSLSNYREISDFSFLKDYPNLTHLDLSKCAKIEDISFLKDNPNLTHLNLCECRHISDVSILENCPNLIQINLESTAINDISFLQSCPHLNHVNLTWCRQINDFSFLKNCYNLTHVILEGCRHINDDFSFLKDCQNLTQVDLSCTYIKDISFMQNLPILSQVNLSCTQINDISVMQNLSNLSHVNLSGCRHINDFSLLQNFLSLAQINLNKCQQIKKIDFLQNCQHLNQVDIRWCVFLDDNQTLDHFRGKGINVLI